MSRTLSESNANGNYFVIYCNRHKAFTICVSETNVSYPHEHLSIISHELHVSVCVYMFVIAYSVRNKQTQSQFLIRKINKDASEIRVELNYNRFFLIIFVCFHLSSSLQTFSAWLTISHHFSFLLCHYSPISLHFLFHCTIPSIFFSVFL